MFAVCSANGDIDARQNATQGVYFHDTRFVRRLSLTINGVAMLAESADIGQGRRCRFHLVNRPLHLQGRLVPRGTIRIARVRTLATDIRETLLVQNLGPDTLSVDVGIRISARFEHIFDARLPKPASPGRLRRRWEDNHLRHSYAGIDGRTRNTTVTFSPEPSVCNRSAIYRLQLAPQEVRRIRMRIFLSDLGSGDLEVIPPAPAAVPRVRGMVVESDNESFNRVMEQAFDDLQMLATRQQGESFFAAGVPWFVALFGRDSLLTALQMLAYQPGFAADSLRLLARYQGQRVDAWRDEEPGKIPHELRTGEKAIMAEVPHSRYYGTVDATPLFIILLGEYLRWTGDRSLAEELHPNIERALDWIDRADHDGDGFVDYARQSPKGLENQGWKDSWNGIRHRDGTTAVPPIALVEVQAYVYSAKLAAARLYRSQGNGRRAGELERAAARLRGQFHRRFWLSDRSTYALALDKGGRRVESSTSNPGHALWCGIAGQPAASSLVRTLMSDAMFSGWGIRTLAADELAYDPDDYQVGAVWPHDNAIILAGLKRYGFEKEAARLFTGMFEAAQRLPDGRLPELFAGYSREQAPLPIAYPQACIPQAWAAGALPFMLQAMLGLQPDAAQHELRVLHPTLPDWLSTVVLRDLRVGEATADLQFVRGSESTRVLILRQDGPLRITVVAGDSRLVA